MIKFLLISALFVNYGSNFGSISHGIEKFDTEAECRAALQVAIDTMEIQFSTKTDWRGKTGFEGQCKPYHYD